jgi:hypothetical protein
MNGGRDFIKFYDKGKGKVNCITGHNGTEGE